MNAPEVSPVIDRTLLGRWQMLLVDPIDSPVPPMTADTLPTAQLVVGLTMEERVGASGLELQECPSRSLITGPSLRAAA